MTLVAVEPASLTDASDAALLAIVPNDGAAMAELAHRYAGYVHAIARRQTGDAHLADDITQAVFLVLWRKAARIRPHALSAWLHQTTRYAAANATRGARRRSFHESKAARTEAVMHESMQEDAALQAVLDDAIAALPSADRRLIVDRYLRQVDTVSLATERGLTPSAVQKRIERALARLRTTLARRVRLAGGVAVTPAAVAAALAAAGPSPASAGLLAAITTPIAANATVATLAASVPTAVTLAKLKAIAVAALLLIVGGSVVEFGRRHWKAEAPMPASLSSRAPVAPAAVEEKPFSVVGRLKSGASIEFNGIAVAPSLRNQWFAADGRPLPERPYGAVDWLPRGDEFREYAFHAGANTNFDRSVTSDDRALAQLAFRPGETKWNLHFPLSGRGNNAKRLYDRFALVADKTVGPPITVRFEVAAGSWQTILRSRRDGPSSASTDSVAVTFGQPYQGDSGSACIVYTEATLDEAKRWFEVSRVLAIDTAGHVHETIHEDNNVFAPADHAAVPTLLQRVPSARLNQMPLSEVINYLKDAVKVPIEADWASIAAAGYDAVAPVRLLADNMTVAEVLHDALDTASTPKTNLIAIVDGAVVRIGPVESFRNRLPRVITVQGVPLGQIDRFEIRLRQFNEWIEFTNLPARPGEAATVTVRTSEDEPRPLVQPGMGIGDVRLGMTRIQVIGVLGPPERELGSVPEWPSRGIGVIFDRDDNAATITGGSVAPGQTDFHFQARTAEGLGLGSTREQIIAAYGPPESTTVAEEGTQFMSYGRRGIEFKLRDNRVVLLTVSGPVDR